MRRPLARFSWLTQPSEAEVRRSEEQAKCERQVRDMKDLAGEAYMGKNE